MKSGAVTTTLDEVESNFQSKFSAVNVDTPHFVSPGFWKKIWSITENQACDVVCKIHSWTASVLIIWWHVNFPLITVCFATVVFNRTSLMRLCLLTKLQSLPVGIYAWNFLSLTRGSLLFILWNSNHNFLIVYIFSVRKLAFLCLWWLSFQGRKYPDLYVVYVTKLVLLSEL